MNMQTMLELLAGGMYRTFGIFVWTLVLSMPFGLIVCFGRMSKNPVIRWITKIYISIMRGTPLMLQLLVWYFMPYYLFGATLPHWFRFGAIVIGFVFNYAAYFAEIYRSGIESIPVGQYEAAQILGYNKHQTFRKIIMPQMIKNTLPAITNEIITLVKDTSLAYALAYSEVFAITKQIVAGQRTFFPFIVAGLFYYIFNAIVAAIMEKFEKKLDYYH